MDKNNNVNNVRRKSVLGAFTGVAAISVWHKPLVSAVVTPAHAQMSPTTPTAPMVFRASGPATIIVKQPNNQKNSLIAEMFDAVVPEANADEPDVCLKPSNGNENGGSVSYEVQAKATLVSEQKYDVAIVVKVERQQQCKIAVDDLKSPSAAAKAEALVQFYDFRWDGTIDGLDANTILTPANPCVPPANAEFSAISESSISVSLNFKGARDTLSFDLVPGDIALPDIEPCQPT